MKRGEARITLRLTGSYLLVFALVVAVLSRVAYVLIAADYRDLLGPAFDTAEGQRGYHQALHTVTASIIAADAVLAALVAVASFLLARSAVQPLILARLREARFAADVAHELRTPLSIIASVAQAARSASESQRDAALHTITEQAMEAGTLVGDLLTLARAEDAQALVLEPVDLAAIAASVISEREQQASLQGITIACKARSTIINGEQARLRQLMRNLLDNAVRYARSVVTVVVDSDGRQARLIVEDDGPGVEAALVPSLFERFVKGSTSTGSGLGLAICRWVAQAHGGSIELGPGSRFIVRLRLMHRKAL